MEGKRRPFAMLSWQCCRRTNRMSYVEEAMQDRHPVAFVTTLFVASALGERNAVSLMIYVRLLWRRVGIQPTHRAQRRLLAMESRVMSTASCLQLEWPLFLNAVRGARRTAETHFALLKQTTKIGGKSDVHWFSLYSDILSCQIDLENVRSVAMRRHPSASDGIRFRKSHQKDAVWCRPTPDSV